MHREQFLESGETCVTGDTWIHTEDGLHPIRDLVGKKVRIYNGESWSEVTPFQAAAESEFYRVGFSDGSSLFVTPGHEFSVRTPTETAFRKLKTTELSVGMILPKAELPKVEDASATLQVLADLIDTQGSKDETGYVIHCGERAAYLQILARRAGIQSATIDGSDLRIPKCSRIVTKRFPRDTVDDAARTQRQIITSIEKTARREPSYCFTEPHRHMGLFGNVLTHQCCLGEIFLPHITSKEELFKCATYIYRTCKHSLAIPCHLKITEDVVHRNMRMGISVTGYLMASDEQKSWLAPCYEHLRAYDVEYSASHGFPVSIKLTTVKPSGTLSLLAGVTPGVHPGYAHYYIRRIRFASSSPLIPALRASGHPMEYQMGFDGTPDHNTLVVDFPCKLPDTAIVAHECSAIRQLEFIRELQTNWSDNSVSCTVYYRKHELPGIKAWLKENYNTCVKSVSFLLHSDHGFKQAPYEEITRERYEELRARIRPLKIGEVAPVDEEDMGAECAGGACPVR